MDLANLRRDLYVIEALKSPDMAVVSRTIRGCSWLVTDEQFSYIIEPNYLHQNVLPHMNTKAASKFVLHIRLHLKKEDMVDLFYKYYEKINLDEALKWLPNCSHQVFIEAVKIYNSKIGRSLFKRLCKRSFEVFEIMCERNYELRYIRYDIFNDVAFLLRTNANKYLDIMEKYNYYCNFGRKHTEILLKNCPDKVLNNIKRYAPYINFEALANHLGPNKIKAFITEHANKKDDFIFQYKNVQPLISMMPKEGKFEFLRELYINRSHADDSRSGVMFKQCASDRSLGSRLKTRIVAEAKQNTYQWYRHAQFSEAFPEIKRLIKTESSPEDRGIGLRVLLTTAGHNLNHIRALLQYYLEKHINEPFKFKINFINAVTSTTPTHKYDDETWRILDEIFHSLEVYNKSDKHVQQCVEAIIVYKILHKQPIPNIVEEKFEFNTLQKLKKSLNEEETEMVFKYIFNHIETKIIEEAANDREAFTKVVSLLEKALDLLSQWNKELVDFPNILAKIKEIVNLRSDKNYAVSLKNIYNKEKRWRKHMFQESLLIDPSQDVCVNILKHDPRLFKRYSSEVETLIVDDNVVLQTLHNKLRIYWPDSLAQEWANVYKRKINEPSGQRALVRGLCALLQQNELLELIQKFQPDSPKIVWSEIDKNLLELRKNFAKLMYHARPQPPPSYVLKYAKGSYLQYALPSLLSIYHNLPPSTCREHLPDLLDGPVSLKKHGIRLAMDKFQSDELKAILSEIWSNTKNASIRAVIFKQTFNLMCKEKNDTNIDTQWNLLKHFIDKLTSEENNMIYVALSEVSKVPKRIQGEFSVKSYKVLNSLPPKMKCEKLAQQVALYTINIIDTVDPDFVTELILDYIKHYLKDENILKDNLNGYRFQMISLITAFLVTTKDLNVQKARYDQIFKPILKLLFQYWKVEVQSQYVGQDYFQRCLIQFISLMKRYMALKIYILPKYVFEQIISEIETNLPIEENYQVIAYCKIITIYIDCCDNFNYDPKADKVETFIPVPSAKTFGLTIEAQKMHDELVFPQIKKKLAKAIVKLLEEEVEKYFPSIREVFDNALKTFLLMICHNASEDLEFGMAMIEDNDSVAAYLTTISVIKPRRHILKKNMEGGNELRMKLKSHPSLEVQIHYYNKLFSNY